MHDFNGEMHERMDLPSFNKKPMHWSLGDKII